jgi:hypothetical protein
MDGDAASLAVQMTPYMSAAAAAFGGAVLAKVRDDAVDATVGLGRRLLQRVFGTRMQGEPVPEPLADVLAYPDDDDAVAALRIAVRKALDADPQLQADVHSMLAAAGVTVNASGDRSIAAQQIGVAVTGDNARIIR